MDDILSFIIGMKLGGGSSVNLTGDIVVTDDGDGNVTIEVKEADSNGD